MTAHLRPLTYDRLLTTACLRPLPYDRLLTTSQVAMDLSNLGIAYRALGRSDIASGLFERAHKLMLAAVGPNDPKTKAILRNLG